MAASRENTERQLELAKNAVSARVQALQAKGIAPEKYDDDPAWRRLDAKYRQIHGRLRHVKEVQSLEAEVQERKTERLAQMAEHKAAKKVKKAAAAKAPEKAEKVAKKPKEGAGKEGAKGGKPKK